MPILTSPLVPPDIQELRVKKDESMTTPVSQTPSTTEGLVAKNVSAYFGEKRAIREVSMSVKPRQVTAIIGPSGCGKSTFIRCLNRMHEVVPGARMEGEIFLDDINLTEWDPVMLRRKVGMVFQKPQPFPTMSVFDNVASGLRLNGIRDTATLDQTVEASLKAAALWDEVRDHLNKPGTSLSGGQQQRLCIARAIAISPQVLLMDEPCSALDPIATSKIEELILELKKNYTIVIVTHNMQQAARISDFTGFMYLGELVEFDKTDKIFTNPSNKVTENYVTGRFG